MAKKKTKKENPVPIQPGFEEILKKFDDDTDELTSTNTKIVEEPKEEKIIEKVIETLPEPEPYTAPKLFNVGEKVVYSTGTGYSNSSWGFIKEVETLDRWKTHVYTITKEDSLDVVVIPESWILRRFV